MIGVLVVVDGVVRGGRGMVGIDDGMRVRARKGVRRGSLRRSLGVGLGGGGVHRLLLRRWERGQEKWMGVCAGGELGCVLRMLWDGSQLAN